MLSQVQITALHKSLDNNTIQESVEIDISKKIGKKVRTVHEKFRAVYTWAKFNRLELKEVNEYLIDKFPDLVNSILNDDTKKEMEAI